MKYKKKIVNAVLYLILLLIAAIMLYPILLLVNISFKNYSEFLTSPIGLVQSPTFQNYITVWESMHVIGRALNTIWMAAIACALNIIVCVLAAYPLSRKFYAGSGAVYIFLLASMFFPGSLVANLILLKDILHVYGGPVALILVWMYGSLTLNIFMLTNTFKGLPKDLDEAAYIDGCGYYRFIFSIGMPLTLPMIATLIMLKAIGAWNDFLSPFIWVTDENFKTLSTGLYLYTGQYAAQWQLYSAAIFIVALPMILIYIFGQRYIIEGMLAGSLKG